MRADITVSAGLVTGLCTYAASRGAEPRALLAKAGIDPAILEDADARVAMTRYRNLMHAAQAACRDPALALHFGEDIDASYVTIVGLIMNASATMAEAFGQLQRFGSLAAEVEVGRDQPRFELVQRSSSLWMADRRLDPDDFPELTESTFTRLVCGPRRFLPAPHVLEVHVTHAAPDHAAEYDRIFQCPVTFGSGWNALRLDPQIAAWPVALQPRYVFGVLTERAEALARDLASARTVRGEVEHLLLQGLHTGDATAETISRQIGISRQTLFRRLKAEDTSFERVLDDLRHRMALHYLGSGQTSVNETAYLVGFSEPAAFSRAFKRWTGQNPKDVRPARR